MKCVVLMTENNRWLKKWIPSYNLQRGSRVCHETKHVVAGPSQCGDVDTPSDCVFGVKYFSLLWLQA